MKAKHINQRQKRLFLGTIITIFLVTLAAFTIPWIASNANADDVVEKVEGNIVTDVNGSVDVNDNSNIENNVAGEVNGDVEGNVVNNVSGNNNKTLATTDEQDISKTAVKEEVNLPTMDEAIAMLKDKYFTGQVQSGEGSQIPLAFFIDKHNTGQEVVDCFFFVFDGEYDNFNPQYFNIVEGSTGADFRINYEDSFLGAQRAIDVFLGSDKQPYKVAILVKDDERDITGTLNIATELITEAELFSMMGSKYYCEYDDESYGMSVHYQNSLLKENNKFVLHIKASFDGEIIEDSVDLDKFYFAARLQNNTLHYCWGKQHRDSFDPNLSSLKVNNDKIVSFSYLGHDLLLDENPSISTVEISKSYNYTGSQIKPAGADVVVKDSSGNEVEPSNYELSYGDNVNAGKGTVTAKGIEGKIQGEATGEFTINKASVTIPAEDKTVYTYNGEEQTYKVEPSDKYSVSNDKRTNAGSQTVTISLLDPDNYKWENGLSDEISYTFTINKASVTIPAADTSKFVYNGEEQTYKLATSKYYEIANNVQTNAGKYTVSASLKDQENTVWSDNTTAAQVYDFVIAKAEVPEKEKTASGILKINKGSECNISIVTKETAQFGTPYTTKEGVKAEIVSQENGSAILKITTTQDLKFTDPDFEVTVPVESDNYSYTFVAKISIDQEHTHSMIVFPATEATQKTAGHKVYYQCTLCNKYFEDEAGTTEITNLDQWLDGPGKTEDSWEVQFTNHKNAKIAALKAMKKDGDSQTVTDMIDKAIAEIEAIEYDSEISLDENKAQVDKIVFDTESAVEKQRAEDAKKKEESQGGSSESSSAQTDDNTPIVGLSLLALITGAYVVRRKLFN